MLYNPVTKNTALLKHAPTRKMTQSLTFDIFILYWSFSPNSISWNKLETFPLIMVYFDHKEKTSIMNDKSLSIMQHNTTKVSQGQRSDLEVRGISRFSICILDI